MSRLQKFIAWWSIIPILLLANVAVVLAVDPLSPVCQGGAASSPVCQEATPTENPVLHVINITNNVFALVAGVGAIVMILLGAFFYVTSAGKPENAAKARARIVAAVVGLVVIALAWTIVHFVAQKLLVK